MSTAAQNQMSRTHNLRADNDLPEGWTETTLNRLLSSLESGSRPKGGVRGISEGVPSIGGEHLNQDGRFRFDCVKYVPRSFFEKMNRGHIRKGDILVVKDGATTGKVALVREDFPYATAVVNEHVFACRLLSGLYPAFFFYFLFSKEGQERILENFRGSAQGGINQSFAQGTAVRVAPRAEQERIVAKIEELFTQVNAARARLAKVPQILKRFCQSVLAAACSEGEPTSLSEVLRNLKYGTAQKCTHEPTGTPVLRIPNIGDGSVRLDDLKYAKLPARELAALRLEPGDILMIRSNGSVSLVGKTALVSTREAGFVYAGYLIRLRADTGRILPEYLNLALQTHSVREQIEIPARSTSGVHNINSTEVLRLHVNLPDLNVQRAMVRRVEALFKLADAIEKRVEAATKRADKLTQAILAKAFRGELVPTEAELARREGRDYEPASALLARIKAKRQASEDHEQ